MDRLLNDLTDRPVHPEIRRRTLVYTEAAVLQRVLAVVRQDVNIALEKAAQLTPLTIAFSTPEEETDTLSRRTAAILALAKEIDRAAQRLAELTAVYQQTLNNWKEWDAESQ